jgi:hypothetical protein
MVMKVRQKTPVKICYEFVSFYVFFDQLKDIIYDTADAKGICKSGQAEGFSWVKAKTISRTI